ncbi:Leucine-rich repeat-containing protein 72, partial [Ophiophagus hannah]
SPNVLHFIAATAGTHNTYQQDVGQPRCNAQLIGEEADTVRGFCKNQWFYKPDRSSVSKERCSNGILALLVNRRSRLALPDFDINDNRLETVTFGNFPSAAAPTLCPDLSAEFSALQSDRFQRGPFVRHHSDRSRHAARLASWLLYDLPAEDRSDVTSRNNGTRAQGCPGTSGLALFHRAGKRRAACPKQKCRKGRLTPGRLQKPLSVVQEGAKKGFVSVWMSTKLLMRFRKYTLSEFKMTFYVCTVEISMRLLYLCSINFFCVSTSADLFNNPLSHECRYRLYVIYHIPSVTLLDRKEITRKERESAVHIYNHEKTLVLQSIGFGKRVDIPLLPKAAFRLTPTKVIPFANPEDAVFVRAMKRGMIEFSTLDWGKIATSEEKRLGSSPEKRPEKLTIRFR